MKRFLSIALALIAVPAASPRAEPLTISQAIRIALEKNPSARQAAERLHQLQSSVSGSRSMLFPSVSGFVSGQYRKDPITNPLALFGGTAYNSYSFGLQAQQPLWVSGGISGAVDLANANESLGELDNEITRRDLTLNVIQAFYSILLNDMSLGTLKKQKEVGESLVKTIEHYRSVGRTQLLDVLQVRTQLALLTPKIANAANQVRAASTQLAMYLDDRSAREIEVLGSLNPPLRSALDEALVRQKQELRLLENERVNLLFSQLDATKSLTLAKDLPSLSATAGWARSAYTKNDLLDQNATNWSLGLQLSIPLFSGLSSIHSRNGFASQEAQLQIQKEGVLGVTLVSQAQSQANLETSVEATRSSSLAFELASQSLREAERNYRLGTITLVQYQNSQSSLLEAELALNQARYDYIVNYCKYAIARGFPAGELTHFLEEKRK